MSKIGDSEALTSTSCPAYSSTPLLLSPSGENDPLVNPGGRSPKPTLKPAWTFKPGSELTPPTSPNGMGSSTGTGTGKRLAFSTDKDDPEKATSNANSSSTPLKTTYHQGPTKQFLSVTHANAKDTTITSMDSSLFRNNNDNTMTNTSTVDSTTFRKIRNRMSSKYGRMRKRVVFKNGDCNLHPTNISKRRRKYLADIFVTLVDLQVRN